MGVTGLWKLIDPCGKPVPVETLESKVLAVDISIWLHQVVKGFQDNKGSALPNAHLLGLFHRLCKLLYYRVKPVFVFDGCVPQLKRDTIARRQLQRSKLNTEAERIQALLLESLAKEKVVQQALGANADLLLKSPRKKNIRTTRTDDIDDIFKLPELPAATASSKAEAGNESELDDSYTGVTSDYTTTSTTDDSSFDESHSRHYYNANLQAIDVRSKHFKALPADVRHEILVDIKETRKQSSWGRLHELPSKGDDFSTFQMKRLLKRRAVQESIEEVQQEMGGRSLTYNELKNLLTEDGIVEPSAMEVGSKQICSDEHTRFLLVRDLKKKLATVDEDIKKVEPIESKKEETTFDEKPSCSHEAKTNVEGAEDFKNNALDSEYANDLELAIALSLEESNVYNAKDYNYDSDENIRLNKDQRKQLQNAATGPARAFMIEYAGMNEEEVVGIMEKTQNDTANDESCVLKDTEDDSKIHLTPEDIENIKLHVTAEDTEEDDIKLHVSTDSDSETELKKNKSTISSSIQNNEINLTNLSDTDSDLEEVSEIVENLSSNNTTTKVVSPNKCLQLVVDLTNSLEPQDDLFADIFENANAINIQFEDNTISEKKSVVNNKHQVEKEILNSNENVNSVLEELKKQANEIKNISLDDIKIGSSVIVLSDDETSKVNHEIIEVFDDNRKETILKSPNLKTPSKNKSISEYFETNYLIKRTPDKPKDDESLPKVKSPFFINKTPKSSRKRPSNGSVSLSPENKLSKASKSLFSNFEKAADENEIPKPIVTAENVLSEAANILKDQKTTDELKVLALDIEKEKSFLENERNRQDRMGMSINQRMNSECQELLRLFGIPYIVAPMEAEAQCAFLNATELTNGTITDDSDIWLFGGRTVYKNFFAQNKHVLEFCANEIEKSFNCDRIKLIQLACLVGSDYTTGIHGIGAVTAMEILASFSSKNDQFITSDNSTAISASITTLSRFRDWWVASKSSTMPPGNSTRQALLKKLKNIELNDGFPNVAVINAYLDPKIDDNKDTFSWGYPDVESIREFAKKKLGWTTSKTDDIIMPVLKKLNEKKSQATIKNYFNVKSAISLRQMKVSKRVQNAIDKMSGKVEDVTPEKPKGKQKTRAKRKTESKTTKEDSEESEQNQQADISFEASTSTGLQTDGNNRETRKRKIILPETKQIIPQRVKDIEQMRKNKEMAIEVLKKTSKKTKTKKQNV